MSDEHLGALVDESVIDALDELAGEARTSRSEIVRQGLTEWLSEQSEIPDYLRRELRREKLKRKNRMRWQRIYFPKNVAEKIRGAFESGTLDDEINPGAVEEIREIYVEDAELLFEDDPERREAAVEFVESLADHAEEAESVSEFDRLDPEAMFDSYAGVEDGRSRSDLDAVVDDALDRLDRGPRSRDPDDLARALSNAHDVSEELAREAVDRALTDHLDGGESDE